jgi:uncharacterized protein (DUF433 family)
MLVEGLGAFPETIRRLQLLFRTSSSKCDTRRDAPLRKWRIGAAAAVLWRLTMLRDSVHLPQMTDPAHHLQRIHAAARQLNASRGSDMTTDPEDALIEQFIEPDPWRPNKADAILKGYGVPVWALAGYFQQDEPSVNQAMQDYELPEEVVRAALAFYRRYRAIIDDRVMANFG